MNIIEAYKEIQDNTNFKKWFGKSIFHTNGEPHTFYHGTDSDIKAFSHAHIGKGVDQLGSGFYFTNNPEVAHSYTDKSGQESGGNIMPVHLRVEKPIRTNDEKPFTSLQIQKLITSAPDHHEKLQNFGDVSYEGYHKVLRGAVDAYSDIPKHKAIHSISNDFYGNHHSEFLKNLTQHTGHDAVIDARPAAGGNIVVNIFHPNQIKSAIGNNAGSAFSKKSDNITESTDNFKKWFGNSTTHTDGVPHTFYHGTSSDFKEFKSGHGNQWGNGLYFIRSPKIASEYATGETNGVHSRIAPKGNAAPNVIPVYLKMEKPFVMDDDLTKETLNSIQKHVNYSLKDHTWSGMKNRDLRQAIHLNSDQETANKIIQKAGFDGIREKHEHSIHMVFNPTQVKSSIGNSGAYSKDSNDITEAFDKPLDKTEVPQDSMLHAMGSMSAAMVGGDNFSMHKLKGSGYMVQFDKNGATELHHVDDDLQGGYLKTNQPSMRLIGTYRSHIKDLLDSGRRVRIVAHDKLADSFHRISSRLVSMHPEYSISAPKEETHDITGDKLKSWELNKS